MVICIYIYYSSEPILENIEPLELNEKYNNLDIDNFSISDDVLTIYIHISDIYSDNSSLSLTASHTNIKTTLIITRICHV